MPPRTVWRGKKAPNLATLRKANPGAAITVTRPGGGGFLARQTRPAASRTATGAPAPSLAPVTPQAPDPLAGLAPGERASVSGFDAQTKAREQRTKDIYAALAEVARQDADASKTRLGSLAQMAGQATPLPAGLSVASETAALPGVLSQGAQQRALTESALAIDTAGKLPTLASAAGASALEGLISERQQGREELVGGFRSAGAQREEEQKNRALQLRGQNLQYLGGVLGNRTRLDVARMGSVDKGADRVAKLKAESARLDNQLRIARENNDRAREIALGNQQARIQQAINAAENKRKTTGPGSTNYATLRAKIIPQMRTLLAGKPPKVDVSGIETAPAVAPLPRADVFQQAIAQGLTPVDAWRAIASLSGFRKGPAYLAALDPSAQNSTLELIADFFDLLEGRVGAKRARAAIIRETGMDPLRPYGSVGREE